MIREKCISVIRMGQLKMTFISMIMRRTYIKLFVKWEKSRSVE